MYGQLVIGPCGSGKSTYCRGMAELMRELKREVAIFNIDPSNEDLPYDCAVDIRELINAETAAEENNLGPNATQIYCLNVLASRLDWFSEKLAKYRECYILFDCPGQFELYTDCESMKEIVEFLTSKQKMQLAAVTLIDCLLCSSGHSYISAVMMSLSMMIHLELPHVNVLSKMDSLRRVAPEMAFNLEFYLKAGEGNLESLIVKLFPEDFEVSHPMDIKYSQFVKALSQVSEDFSLVGFVPLAIEDKESALHCLAVCDRANGYSFSAEGFHLQDEALKADTQPSGEYYTGLQERFQEGPFCTSCGRDARGKSLLRCSACKKAEYCDRECQKADWSVHKRTCNYQQKI
jgi:GTPase SAR1 family protein